MLIKKLLKIKKILILLIFIFLILIIYKLNKFIFVTGTNCNDSIGIIDTRLRNKYTNVIISETTKINSDADTHGDELIEFIYNCQKDIKLFYYDASDINGKINTNNLIQGLNWMVENNVERVNLSLSSKFENKDLEMWIQNHPEIIIFVSYNNSYNTYDYPAQYKGTYASGCDSRIIYKDNDIKYKTNNIIVINNGFNLYKGNSFLSVLSMLNYKN